MTKKNIFLFLGATALLFVLFFSQEKLSTMRGFLASTSSSQSSSLDTETLLPYFAHFIDPTNEGRTIRKIRLFFMTNLRQIILKIAQGYTLDPFGDTSNYHFYDVNRDGFVRQDDIRSLARIVQILLRCGDGTIDADIGEQCDDSNTVSGDGCTAICRNESHGVCIGAQCTPVSGAGLNECTTNAECGEYFPPSSLPSSSDMSSSSASSEEILPPWRTDAERLTLQFQSMASRNVVAGERNVPLLRFTAQAKYMPVALTQLVFSIHGVNALYNIHDLHLMADTNGDGVVDTEVQHFHPSPLAFDDVTNRQEQQVYDVYFGGTSFDTLNDNIFVSAGTPMIFEIQADISSHPVTSSIDTSLDFLMRQPSGLGAVADYTAPDYSRYTTAGYFNLSNATIDQPCTFFSPHPIHPDQMMASCNIKVDTINANTSHREIQ